jgi:hypothetical protein
VSRGDETNEFTVTAVTPAGAFWRDRAITAVARINPLIAPTTAAAGLDVLAQ